jgi:cob(I)alamin adenosyltransferase
MKIYTGGGDQGKTSLFSGERVFKAHARIDAYGDVDELNSVLGALAAALPVQAAEIGTAIARLQADLMKVGAWLATSPESPALAQIEALTTADAAALEAAIDHLDASLPTLRSFILPGGHPAAAWAHIARTVCRRAERRVVGLNGADADPARQGHYAGLLVYLNRLSDYLFVLARHLNHVTGISERIWKT